MKEKHLPYFRVSDALKQEDCPVCYLIKDAAEKFFDDHLYEKVNDMEFNVNFRETRGFCNHHSYKFMSYNDGLAVSKMHKLLIGDVIEELESFKANKKDKEKCILCEYLKELEKRYLSIIKDYLGDNEFQKTFSASEGLCVSHYKKIIFKEKSIPKWFSDFHLRKYQELLYKLNLFLDNNEFSSIKKDFKDYDEKIWKKSVKALFGFEGKTNN